MKRTFLLLAFLIYTVSPAAANPPTDIIATFDLAKSMVYADIMHDTKHPKEHFIYLVQVSVNGKKLIRQELTEQVTPDMQKVAYLIPGLKAGDKVSFDADCNKYGDMQKEFIVKDAAPAKQKTGKK
jgi:hypothetical protein